MYESYSLIAIKNQRKEENKDGKRVGARHINIMEK